MSGGSWDHVYRTLEDISRRLMREPARLEKPSANFCYAAQKLCTILSG